MICTRCLTPPDSRRDQGRLGRAVLRLCTLLAGSLLLWLVFFLIGRTLLELPSNFHEGTFFGRSGARR